MEPKHSHSYENVLGKLSNLKSYRLWKADNNASLSEFNVNHTNALLGLIFI
jgi:hypothetical protein